MRNANGCQVCTYLSKEEERLMEAHIERLRKAYGIELSRSQVLRAALQKEIKGEKR